MNLLGNASRVVAAATLVVAGSVASCGEGSRGSSGSNEHGGSSGSSAGVSGTPAGGSGGAAGSGAGANAGASSGADPGGAAGATPTGGASGVGGTADAGAAGIVTGGSGGSSSGGVAGSGVGGGGSGGSGGAPRVGTVPVYDGLRGESFNKGWKFNRGDVSGAEASSFNDSSWRSLDVPHDWSIELAFNSNSPAGSNGGFLDGGIGWYRKTFTLDQASMGKRILIEFDGVYMNSEVWINGASLGTRPYGYSSFEYDLTASVNFSGNNVLAVRVNNNQPNSRWYSGSGIYRNVWLTKVSPVHVPNSGVFVTTPTVSSGSASVNVVTEVQNQSSAAASVTLTTTITDSAGATVTSNDSPASSVAAGATTPVNQTLTVPNPRLWSLTSPNLYRVRVSVKTGGTTVDSYVTTLGIRTVAFNANTGFSLNGQSMKLRGVNMHHDLGALGAAVNYRAIERQVEILQSMGVNAIRTSHNPPAPELLEITDRLGVLILDEAFDTWEQTKTTNDYGLYFTAWAQRDLQAMVKRDRNHPSVILWSIGNEVGGATTTTAQNLKSWVLAMDTTRAVTWASNKMGGPHVSEGDDRNVANLLDVAGYNYAPYAGDYDADHAAHPGWKILGTEIAAAVRSRGVYHTPASTVTKATSQSNPDRQCSSYDNEAAGFGETAALSYKYENDRAFVAGSFLWAGFDYFGEPTPYSSYPSKSSYYGAIDTAGFPKDVYYFYKSRWTTAPMVHLLPHWNWTGGTMVTVYAYNNCESVELFLNDASQGSKTMAPGTLRLEWVVPWATGTLRADCRSGASVAATDQIRTAGAAAGITLSADRTTLNADGVDLAFITGDIRDSDGNFAATATNQVTFAVTGPGTLVGLDNGNPQDTTSHTGTNRRAFSGKVLAIVRSNGTAGSIVVNATSSGLTAGSVTVTAR